MSGHSHWAGIKHKKQLTDLQRGRIFSKLVREIELSAKEGKDPEINPKLRLAIEKAKNFNMPSENIERAIKRGAGELPAENLEEFLYEAYGPGGVALVIEGITDNKNRTLGEIKQILNQHNGKLVGEGGVRWMFEKRSCIVINLKNQNEEFKDKEKLEMTAIDAGAEDFYSHNDLLDIYGKVENLEKLKKNLTEKGIKIESVSLDWVPKEMIEVDEKTKETCKKLFESLDENEAVQEIYSNLKI